MSCQRCEFTRQTEVKFRVRSEFLDLKVCPTCAAQAAALGLFVTSLTEDFAAAPPEPKPAVP